jgi:hypothetical protein
MKKLYLTAILSGMTTISSFATGIPVVDLTNLEQQIQNEFANIAQYTSTVTNTLKSASQLEEQVRQLGSYADINNLPGVGAIKGIVGDGLGLVNQGQGIYGQIQGLTNPNQFTGQFQSILNRYGNYQNLLGGSGASGITNASNQYTIPMAQAAAQAVDNFKSNLESLNGQRNTLQQQLSGAMQRLSGASTQAEVEKINGEIAGINGALNSTNEQIQQAAETSAQVSQQAAAAADAADQAAAVQEATDLEQGASGFANELKFSDDPVKW